MTVLARTVASISKSVPRTKTEKHCFSLDDICEVHQHTFGRYVFSLPSSGCQVACGAKNSKGGTAVSDDVALDLEDVSL